MSHPSASIALLTAHHDCYCLWAHGQRVGQLIAHLLCTNKCPECLLVPLPSVMQLLPANWLRGMLQNCLRRDLALRQRLCEQRPWDVAALNAEILFCPTNVLSVAALSIREKPERKGFGRKSTLEWGESGLTWRIHILQIQVRLWFEARGWWNRP